MRDLNGPWLLYDNREDPYQLRNLVEEGGFRELMERLGEILCHVMREAGDERGCVSEKMGISAGLFGDESVRYVTDEAPEAAAAGFSFVISYRGP